MRYDDGDGTLTTVHAAAVFRYLTGAGYGRDEANLAMAQAITSGTWPLRDHYVAFRDGQYTAGPVHAVTAEELADRDARGIRLPETLARLLHAIETVDAHLDSAAPEIYRMDHPASRLANRWRRIAGGPVSESVEASDALNLATGGNPRKPRGSARDITAELGDTAFAALLAIQSEVKDAGVTWGIFLAAMEKALARVPREAS